MERKSKEMDEWKLILGRCRGDFEGRIGLFSDDEDGRVFIGLDGVFWSVLLPSFSG